MSRTIGGLVEDAIRTHLSTIFREQVSRVNSSEPPSYRCRECRESPPMPQQGETTFEAWCAFWRHRTLLPESSLCVRCARRFGVDVELQIVKGERSILQRRIDDIRKRADDLTHEIERLDHIIETLEKTLEREGDSQ